MQGDSNHQNIGVGNLYFLRTALNAVRKQRGLEELDALDFLELAKEHPALDPILAIQSFYVMAAGLAVFVAAGNQQLYLEVLKTGVSEIFLRPFNPERFLSYLSDLSPDGNA